MRLFSINSKLSFLAIDVACCFTEGCENHSDSTRINRGEPCINYGPINYTQLKYFLNFTTVYVCSLSCKAMKKNKYDKGTQDKATEIHLRRTQPSSKLMDLSA